MNRLEKIFNVVKNLSPVTDIFDTCCDHGKLGIMALCYSKDYFVHFNDISNPIIQKLKIKLKSFDSKRYTLKAQDAKQLDIDPDKPSIVIIAGVGGECALEIMQGLSQRNQAKKSYFIICSHYHSFELRLGLANLKLGLITEDFFFDGKWPYEMLVVSWGQDTKITPFSRKLFDLTNLSHRKYLSKMLKHYSFKNNEFMMTNLKLALLGM